MMMTEKTAIMCKKNIHHVYKALRQAEATLYCVLSHFSRV